MATRKERVRRDTVSVRIGPEGYSEFEGVCGLLRIDKSGFLKACIERIISDNKLLLENHEKIQSLVNYIKSELAKLPSDIVVVRNGSWKDVSETLVLIACDNLFSSSELVWKKYKEYAKLYQLDLLMEDETFVGEELFDLGDIGLLSLPVEKTTDPNDLFENEELDLWTDVLEVKKMVLILSLSDAFKMHTANKIVREALEKADSECRRMHVLEFDVKGKFKRSGDRLTMPAGIGHKDKKDTGG